MTAAHVVVCALTSKPTLATTHLHSQLMTSERFEDYSRRAAFKHFHGGQAPPLLRRWARPGTIADLGCGDGSTATALQAAGLLGDTTYLVDLSPERVADAVASVTGGVGIVATATNVAALPNSSLDGLIAGQLIEHLEDDRALTLEIARLLKPGGWWYVGTVLRAKYAWWLYSVDGKRRLDPTHVREYRAVDELIRVLRHPHLSIDEIRHEPLRFPITDLVARGVARAGLLSQVSLSTLYTRSPLLRALRHVRAPLPIGYRLLEAAGRRLDDTS